MYLVKHKLTESQKNRHKQGYDVRETKSHIWVSEKNNTACNMYSGSPKAFDLERWFISENRTLEVCRRCRQNIKKGMDCIRDNNESETPKKEI